MQKYEKLEKIGEGKFSKLKDLHHVIYQNLGGI